MENRASDADSKFYVDDQGERPDIVVCFLDAYFSPGGETNGVVIQVDQDRLAEFDFREVRYERIGVSRLVASPLPAGERIWTYRANPTAIEMSVKGRESGRAYISRHYVEYCRRGFELGGKAELDAYEGSTDPPGIPLRTLSMVRQKPK